MLTKPKKSLGQNFLVDANIQRKITAACAFQSSDTILEIGAGYGAITGLIAQSVKRLFALEIDKKLCGFLTERFAAYPNVTVINHDILEFNLRKYFSGSKARIKVIGNIPYYITSPIIERLLTFRDKIEVVYLTVQKEFAERITALPGSKTYGSFSCFVRYYTEPEKMFLIKKNSFKPVPKVDSCFLKLEVRSEPAVKVKDEELFFAVIRGAFNQRRKTLRNSLEGIVPAKKLEEFFSTYGIDVNVRPEKLGLSDFAHLTEI